MKSIATLVVAAIVLATGAAGETLYKPIARDVKLDLAHQYLDSTHSRFRVEQLYTKQLRMSMQLCQTASCQSDMDRAVEKAGRHAADAYDQQLAKIIANKLSEQELKVLLEYSHKPEVQAMVRIFDGLSDELARMNNSIGISAYREVGKEFCPEHPGICRFPDIPPTEGKPAVANPAT